VNDLLGAVSRRRLPKRYLDAEALKQKLPQKWSNCVPVRAYTIGETTPGEYEDQLMRYVLHRETMPVYWAHFDMRY